MGCSSQGGWAGGWGCVSKGEVERLEVTDLRRVVGTGCCLWSQLLPEAVVDGEKEYAELLGYGQAIRTIRPTRLADLVFLSGFAEEPGVMNSQPMIGCLAAVKASISNNFGFLYGRRRDRTVFPGTTQLPVCRSGTPALVKSM